MTEDQLRVPWSGTLAVFGVPVPDGGAPTLGQQRVLGYPKDPASYSTDFPLPVYGDADAMLGFKWSGVPAIVGAIERTELDGNRLLGSGWLLYDVLVRLSQLGEPWTDLSGGRPVPVTIGVRDAEIEHEDVDGLRTVTVVRWTLDGLKLFSESWDGCTVTVAEVEL